MSQRRSNSLELIKVGIPDIMPIIIGDVFLISVYKFFKTSETFSWMILSYVTFESVSLLLLGWLSDKIGKKLILIIIQALTTVLTLIFIINPSWEFVVYAIGLIFNPGPPARSSLLHNQKKLSSISKKFLTPVRLLSISWIFQYTPWTFAFILYLLKKETIFSIIFVLLIFSLMFTSFSYFKEKREERLGLRKKSEYQSIASQLHNSWKGIVATRLLLLGAFFAQGSFWIPFQKIDFLANSGFLFSLVGLGATLGSFHAMIYEKTPHLSVISTSYQFGFGISLLSSLYLIVMNYSSNTSILDANLLNQFTEGILVVLIAAIGGAYLPFLFEVVTLKRAKLQGIMLSVLEIIQSIASNISIGIVLLIKVRPILLLIVALSFMAATIIQFIEIINKSKRIIK